VISVSALIWIIVGLIAGVLARLFVPGRQLIIGVILTIIVGIAGAVIGGFLLDALHIGNSTPTIAWRIIEGIIGATILLFIYHSFAVRRGIW